ncbi:S-layer homology domain-containing protein [Paenibacillus silviterrae]|uniref:S-layer homology domain-containing protein n=1 Tax=Paenibacillus silviterrae TaxID=3242194 RepID=UPI002542FE9A|nr:S-layer homology domain-containing protein [Paenibacillus chinjuensis]
MRMSLLAVLLFLTYTKPVRAAEAVTLFSDIKGHWAVSVIHSAVAAGYVDGYEDGTFRPESRVSRAHFTVMLVKALKLPVAEETSNRSWYTPFVQTSVDLGIIQPDDFAEEGWNRGIRRAEILRMTARAVLGKEAGTTLEEWSGWAAAEGLLSGDEKGELHLGAVSSRAEAVAFLERVRSLYGIGA